MPAATNSPVATVYGTQLRKCCSTASQATQYEGGACCYSGSAATTAVATRVAVCTCHIMICSSSDTDDNRKRYSTSTRSGSLVRSRSVSWSSPGTVKPSTSNVLTLGSTWYATTAYVASSADSA
jgi:hypothetical protein